MKETEWVKKTMSLVEDGRVNMYHLGADGYLFRFLGWSYVQNGAGITVEAVYLLFRYFYANNLIAMCLFRVS